MSDAPQRGQPAGQQKKPRIPVALTPAEAEVLKAVWDRHARELYSFAIGLTKCEADAADLVSDVFQRISRDAGALAGIADLQAFLRVMARRIFVDTIRQRAAREQRHEHAGIIAQITAPADAPLTDETLRAAISTAFRAIPADQRRVVEARLLRGESLEEIAKMENVPLQTVASRFRYGLNKLRDQLRPYHDCIQKNVMKKNTPEVAERIIKPLEPKRVPSAAPGLEAVAALAADDGHDPIDHSAHDNSPDISTASPDFEPTYDGLHVDIPLSSDGTQFIAINDAGSSIDQLPTAVADLPINDATTGGDISSATAEFSSALYLSDVHFSGTSEGAGTSGGDVVDPGYDVAINACIDYPTSTVEPIDGSGHDAVDPGHGIVDTGHDVVDPGHDVIETGGDVVTIENPGQWIDNLFYNVDPGHDAIDTGGTVVDTGHEVVDTGHEVVDPTHDAADTGGTVVDTGHEVVDPTHDVADTGGAVLNLGHDVVDNGGTVVDINGGVLNLGHDVVDPAHEIVDPGVAVVDHGSVDLVPGQLVIDPSHEIVETGGAVSVTGTGVLDLSHETVDPSHDAADTGGIVVDTGHEVVDKGGEVVDSSHVGDAGGDSHADGSGVDHHDDLPISFEDIFTSAGTVSHGPVDAHPAAGGGVDPSVLRNLGGDTHEPAISDAGHLDNAASATSHDAAASATSHDAAASATSHDVAASATSHDVAASAASHGSSLSVDSVNSLLVQSVHPNSDWHSDNGFGGHTESDVPALIIVDHTAQPEPGHLPVFANFEDVAMPGEHSAFAADAHSSTHGESASDVIANDSYLPMAGGSHVVDHAVASSNALSADSAHAESGSSASGEGSHELIHENSLGLGAAVLGIAAVQSPPPTPGKRKVSE